VIEDLKVNDSSVVKQFVEEHYEEEVLEQYEEQKHEQPAKEQSSTKKLS
jgi:hypothetical protein